MENSTVTYEKAYLVGSNKFKNDRDILASLLKNDTKYSVEEANFIIKSYKERMI